MHFHILDWCPFIIHNSFTHIYIQFSQPDVLWGFPGERPWSEGKASQRVAWRNGPCMVACSQIDNLMKCLASTISILGLYQTAHINTSFAVFFWTCTAGGNCKTQTKTAPAKSFSTCPHRLLISLSFSTPFWLTFTQCALLVHVFIIQSNSLSLYVSVLKGKVWHLGKCTYSWSCWALEKKIQGCCWTFECLKRNCFEVSSPSLVINL